MRRPEIVILLACLCGPPRSAAALFQGQTAAEVNDVARQIPGRWSGNSTCMVKGSPCKDEVNVYHFSRMPGKPGWYSVAANKIVNNEEVEMGTLECKYDSAALTCQIPQGTFHFNVKKNRIEGILTLPDKTVYRLIHLTKDP